MRAIWFCYVMALVSVSTGIMGEWNQLNLHDKGYPLLPMVVNGHVYTTLSEDSYNQTVNEYGLNRVPSVAEDSAYLGTSGTLLGTFNAFQGVFLVGTLGLSGFLQNVFPALNPAWLIGISMIVTLNNMYAIIMFIRGVAGRWL